MRSINKWVVRGVVAAGLIATLSACGSTLRSTPRPTPPAPTPPAPTATATSSATPAPTQSTKADPFPVRHERKVAGLYTFRTPSGNIGCNIDRESGRILCDIGEHHWKVPPRPKSCDPARGTDWGGGIQVRGAGEGEISCISDSARGPINPVLAYGDAVRSGSLRCVVAEAGVKCENTRTGHGFTAARDAYRVF
jgi:Family of unknown function (DUF6636)